MYPELYDEMSNIFKVDSQKSHSKSTSLIMVE